MNEYEIFDAVKEFASDKYTHPDYVARLHAAMMRIERVMMDHIVEWREENVRDGKGLPENTCR